MKKYLLVSIAVVVTAALSGAASAGVITECGAMNGKAYYFQNQLVPKLKGGGEWTDDKISGGQTILVMEGDKPRILYRDSVGLKDSVAEGGKAILVGNGPGHFVVIVMYGGAIEVYHFRLDENGNGEVLLSSIKHDALVRKSSLMRAECRSPWKK
ncbi:MAG: hypothetical protein FJ311_06270 [Rhodospirillales bacterium]|nr:hypothetical protein [Rhodospirillales bacterium]